MRANRLALLCGLLTLAVFLPSLRNGFVWDDGMNVGLNPHLTLDRSGLAWMLTSYREIHPAWGGQWIPLTWLSLAVDKTLWGYKPLGFHLTNIVLHAVSAGLVSLVATRLFASTVAGPGIGLGAVVATLVWSLHPLRVESVAWITERRDVLSGVLVLLAVWLYLKGHLWLPVACFALAVTAKASVVTVPVALLVLDAWRGQLRWRRLAPWVAVSLGATAMGLWALHSAQSLSGYSVLERIGMAGYATVFYLVKTIAPLNLSLLYEAPRSIEWWTTPFLPAVVLVCLVSLVLLVTRSWAALTAWACYLALLLPQSGLLHAGFAMAADRYTYLPSLAPSLLLGAGVSRWSIA